MPSIKYFPFAPAIPWRIKNGKYIIRKIDSVSWNKALDNKEVVIAGFGGLLESFMSLTILETINNLAPNKKLHWIGDGRFNYIVRSNGLANILNIDINLKEYTTPLFMDKSKFVFFNYLNNYLSVFTYYNKFGYYDQRAATRQIFENSLVDWNISYVPKIRHQITISEFENWAKRNKFFLNKPFVLIMPDHTGWSDHKNNCLKWSSQQVKSLAAMLYQHGIELVLCTQNEFQYYGMKLHLLPMRLDYILHILPFAKAVMASDIDILLISLLISKAKIISLKQEGEFSLTKNKKFIFKNGDGPPMFIAKPDTLTPYSVFSEIK
jgi:hypothetical protein